VNDYYQWLSGRPKKLAPAFSAASAAPPRNVGHVVSKPADPEPVAKPIEVQEGSATETFIGRVRDFWNRKK
jgi:hypothetical protein